MMRTVSLLEAQAKLAELVHGLHPDEELIITENDQPIARLTSAPALPPPRKLGTMSGTVIYEAPDFNAPLEDFEEYMS